MSTRRIAFASIVALLVLNAAIAVAAPSRELASALRTLRNLGGGAFSFVVTWSRDPVAPASPFHDWEKAEAQVAALRPQDRAAVIYWLQSHGRGRLYDRGATDADIGPQRFPIDTFTARPTPNPLAGWHEVPFVAGTLGQQRYPGDIQILSGFASVKDDAKSEVHCVSFNNRSAKTATQIRFGYQFLDANSNVLANLTSDRSGTFSTNIDIDGPKSFKEYVAARSGSLQKTLLENCWREDSGTAVLALLQARYVTFKVLAVTYSDATTWSPSASPAP
jgi:hypothetical protein